MRLLLTLIWLLTTMTILAQDGNVKVEGSINIGNHTEADPEEGTIRWSGSDFEGWDGQKWVSLTSQSNTTEIEGYAKDIDGNLYNIITIGDQVWMKQNLKTTKYRNGVPIRLENTPRNWVGVTEGLYTYPNNEPINSSSFGLLYNFRAVDTNLLCPTDWHVPTKDEFEELIISVGQSKATRAEALTFKGTTFWKPPNTSTNSSGFSAVGAGSAITARVANPSLQNASYAFFFTRAYYLTSTEVEVELESGDEMRPIVLTIIPGLLSTNLTPNFWSNNDGYSVRCIKD